MQSGDRQARTPIESWIASIISYIKGIGADPRDPDEERLRKQLFVQSLTLIIFATAVWGLLYLAFQEPLSGAISLGYSLFALFSLVVIRKTRRIRFFQYSLMLVGLLVPFVHNYLLGGFANSSAVVLWALMSPLAALFFFELKQALLWWIVYLLLMLLAGTADPVIRSVNNLPAWLITSFYVFNILGVSSIVFVMLNYFQQQKNEAYRLLRIEQGKAENLLLNILPKEIAAILKNESRIIADNFEGASILFADLVGFTPLTAQMAPVEMVILLNKIFSYFDGLVEKYGLEKIRTIGDSYMVASGVPRPRQDHAYAAACMALEMQDYICQLPPVNGKRIQFRIGINSGPVVGGVIGLKKFVYDIWGDAVNVASRMESHGEADKIQITQATYELLRGDFICEPRGTIDVKGRGAMPTWFLTGIRAAKR